MRTQLVEARQEDDVRHEALMREVQDLKNQHAQSEALLRQVAGELLARLQTPPPPIAITPSEPSPTSPTEPVSLTPPHPPSPGSTQVDIAAELQRELEEAKERIAQLEMERHRRRTPRGPPTPRGGPPRFLVSTTRTVPADSPLYTAAKVGDLTGVRFALATVDAHIDALAVGLEGEVSNVIVCACLP
jgi:FtsZ-binding cell division protein ZapB